jgi:hypothetical protein
MPENLLLWINLRRSISSFAAEFKRYLRQSFERLLIINTNKYEYFPIAVLGLGIGNPNPRLVTADPGFVREVFVRASFFT